MYRSGESLDTPKNRQIIVMMSLMFQSLMACACLALPQSQWDAPEPYDYLKDVCLDCAPPVPSSPDPLVRAQWSASTNVTELQIYRVTQPVSIAAIHPSNALEGWQAWLRGESTTLLVHEACQVTIDWGVERAAWLEFLANTSSVRAGLSEFNTPYPGKTQSPVKYGSQTYRLETNPELYEGVRYTFLDFAEPTLVSNISLVAKVKPISYTGAYSTASELLTGAWYTGAYGVRLNMEATQFNSILIERGDRVAIQGDAHPSMATALVGFGGSPAILDFVQSELWQTNSGHVHGHNVVDQQIMAYPLYWCLSVLDWYWASGNHTGFRELVPDVRSILDERVTTFLDPAQDIVWMGWDDRLGNGWCFHSNNDTCPLEGHWTLAGLITRVCKDLARSLEAVGDAGLAQQYHDTHETLVQQYQQHVPLDQVGVHAVANMINAEIVTDEEVIARWIQTKLNDVATICSWSSFNQYWILQAFAHDIERGLASVELCWGPMLKINKGCFWELSGPDWTTFLKEGDMPPTMPSLCHPWASGVTAWLSHFHGGIQPLLPGYELVLVAPYVSVNHPNVSTTISTPRGSIKVDATLDQNFVLQIEVDSPVGGFVGLRSTVVGACAMNRKRLIVNQETAPQLLDRNDLTHANLPLYARNMTFLRIPQGGRHRLFVSYGCTRVAAPNRIRASPFPAANYPASVSFDRTSQGSGLKTYAPDGYLLLGYNEDQSDVANLPGYVESLQIRTHGWTGWEELPRVYLGASPTDPAFIPNPFNASAIPALGRIGYGEPGYWDPGVLVDVKVNSGARNAQESVLVDVQTNPQKNQSFKLSIYCVGNGKHAVRIMDLETLDPIAATVLVDQYEEGVWYTVTYTKSIRLRVMAMYGIQMSAVAFATASSADVAQE